MSGNIEKGTENSVGKPAEVSTAARNFFRQSLETSGGIRKPYATHKEPGFYLSFKYLLFGVSAMTREERLRMLGAQANLPFRGI